MTTKILQKAAEKTGRVMTENEIKSFLQGTLNLHLATIDQKGEPNIQPVWFYHDSENHKIFFSISHITFDIHYHCYFNNI